MKVKVSVTDRLTYLASDRGMFLGMLIHLIKSAISNLEVQTDYDFTWMIQNHMDLNFGW